VQGSEGLMAINTANTLSVELPARVICILGMHRSGTSCLTGSLQEAGLSLGDCHTWNPHNLRGNRENQAFVDLHDDILTANHGAWDAPPGQLSWRQQDITKAVELLSRHASEPVFGFKDPRALLVLEGWKKLYPAMEFVGIFRHPNAVARSLETRSEMPRDTALKLWYRYNRLLYAQYREQAFPLLCFDDTEADLQGKISQVAGQLGLRVTAGTGFYSSELRTADVAELALPWKINRLYRKLKAQCL
jgi:hypothetical protein